MPLPQKILNSSQKLGYLCFRRLRKVVKKFKCLLQIDKRKISRKLPESKIRVKRLFGNYIIFYSAGLKNSSMQWLWLDPNVFNSQNNLFYESTKLLGIKMRRLPDYDSLTRELAQLEAQGGLGNDKLGIICSSTLSDQVYSSVVTIRPNIEIYIYCMNQQKGNLLTKKYPSIIRAFVRDYVLLDFLKARSIVSRSSYS